MQWSVPINASFICSKGNESGNLQAGAINREVLLRGKWDRDRDSLSLSLSLSSMLAFGFCYSVTIKFSFTLCLKILEEVLPIKGLKLINKYT